MDRIKALFTKWKPNDCKSCLLAAAKRAQLGRNKTILQSKKLEEEIGAFLSQGREEKARIKCESLIHLQKTEVAYDIVETKC